MIEQQLTNLQGSHKNSQCTLLDVGALYRFWGAPLGDFWEHMFSHRKENNPLTLSHPDCPGMSSFSPLPVWFTIQFAISVMKVDFMGHFMGC